MAMDSKKKFRLTIGALAALGVLYVVAFPHYARVDSVSHVIVLANGRTAYVVVVTEQTMYRLRWAVARALARMWPDSDEIRVRRMEIIATDGESVGDEMAPDHLWPGWPVPDGDRLYLSDQPGVEGNLYWWRDGVAVPVPPGEAASIRSRMRRLITEQCKSQGWVLFSNVFSVRREGGLHIYDPGIRGSADRPVTLRVGGKAVHIRFILHPHSAPTAPPPDQTMFMTIESEGRPLFSRAFAYRRTIRGLTKKDWESLAIYNKYYNKKY